jgi:hypothetical protein
MYLGKLGPTVDHIPAQNKAGADLATTLDQYNAIKNSGGLSMQVISTYAGKARSIGQVFHDYAYGIGSDRAKKGGDEILTLANKIATDMESDRNLVTTLPAPLPAAGTQLVVPAPTLQEAPAPQPTIVSAAPIMPTGPATTFAPTVPVTVSPIAPDTSGGIMGSLGEWLPWVAGAVGLGLIFGGGGRSSRKSSSTRANRRRRRRR